MMRKAIFVALLVASCGKAAAPVADVEVAAEVAPLAEDVTAVDVADAPSAVTP